MYEEYQNSLKIILIKRGPYSSYYRWYDALHLFYDKIYIFEYNNNTLQLQGKPISKLKAKHNCSKAAKRDANKSNGLQN